MGKLLDLIPAQPIVDIDPFMPNASAILYTDSTRLYTAVGRVVPDSSTARTIQVELTAGVWALDLLYYKSTDAGIARFELDGALMGTVDTYAASATPNQALTLTNVQVGRTGLHTLSISCPTKNAASTNYFFYLHRFRFRRTAGPTALLPKLSPVRCMPEIIPIDVFATPSASDGTVDKPVDPSSVNNGFVYPSSQAQGNYLAWDLALAAGVYTLDGICRKNSSHGIASVQVDGVTQAGTIDLYAASAIPVNQASIAGIVVPFTGKHRVTLISTTKNASATAYAVVVSALQLRRTAGPPITKYVYPWIVDIDPFLPPSATSYAYGISIDTTNLYNGRMTYGDGTINQWVAWDIPLSAGTWTLEVIYLTMANRPIATVSIDGVSVASYDGYSATNVPNVFVSFPGIKVRRSGVQRLQFTATSKNASSGGYYLGFQHIRLLRTA